MRAFLLGLIFLVGCDDERLHRVTNCGQPCGHELAGVGECSFGTIVCTEDGDESCVGATNPSPDICDGLDNNCDGIVDGDRASIIPCVSTGGRYGYFGCFNGVQGDVCLFPTSQEVCNGIDDDGDGIVDNIPETYCYTGPPGTAGVGMCRPGVVQCRHWQEICVGQVLPEAERCSTTNGRDFDCDGIAGNVAGEETEPADLDMVFIIDQSGSMDRHITSIAVALADSISNMNTGRMTFSIVTAPDARSDTPAPILRLNAGSAHAAVTMLRLMVTETSVHWDEPTIDAMAVVLNDQSIRLDPYSPMVMGQIARRPGARLVLVVVSDEMPQTLTQDGTFDAMSALSNTNAALFVFTTAYIHQQWDLWTSSASTGGTFGLHSSASQIAQNMGSVLTSSACQ